MHGLVCIQILEHGAWYEKFQLVHKLPGRVVGSDVKTVCDLHHADPQPYQAIEFFKVSGYWVE